MSLPERSPGSQGQRPRPWGGAETSAEGPRHPYTGGNHLRAIEKPHHLHGSPWGPAIRWEAAEPSGAPSWGVRGSPGTSGGAATSGQAEPAAPPLGPGSRGLSAVMERNSMCVRKDGPHHRRRPGGDTSHSLPPACDVALEVSQGQTGSPGWYPVLGPGFVLNARACI